MAGSLNVHIAVRSRIRESTDSCRRSETGEAKAFLVDQIRSIGNVLWLVRTKKLVNGEIQADWIAARQRVLTGHD
jgi:hypothetical protein